MDEPYITKAEITLIERLYKIWVKFEASSDISQVSKAASISAAICASVPRLISEIERLGDIEREHK